MESVGRENHTTDILYLFQIFSSTEKWKRGLACKDHCFHFQDCDFLYKGYPILLIIKSSSILILFLIASVVIIKVG